MVRAAAAAVVVVLLLLRRKQASLGILVVSVLPCSRSLGASEPRQRLFSRA